MNIDGVVFWDDPPTSDDYLDSMIPGREIFNTLRGVLAQTGDYSSVKGFLEAASDTVIDSILDDAHVDVDASIECDKLRKDSSDRHAREMIIWTLIKRGHCKWVSKTYTDN